MATNSPPLESVEPVPPTKPRSKRRRLRDDPDNRDYFEEGRYKYGVTNPISFRGKCNHSLPKKRRLEEAAKNKTTNHDSVMTQKLEACLVSHDIFDSKKELSTRQNILRELHQYVNQFVRRIIAKNYPSRPTPAGQIRTFGSYRLGVHTKGADIDTLCVVPRGVHRTDFFSMFKDMLTAEKGVEDIRAIPSAFVPLLKVKYNGIELDITFAQLDMDTIDENQDLLDDRLLIGREISCVRSLNGCRVTDEIIQLVPNPDTFRLTLRAIKFWARQRGIYSNAMGFVGGVTWAMLTARVCQIYPNASPAKLLNKFFRVWSVWEWPIPVLLKNPTSYEYAEELGLSHPVWDPKYNVMDKMHLMPIITPSYPQQNSTHNVTRSTLWVMKNEFLLGKKKTDAIMKNYKKDFPNNIKEFDHTIWDPLFVESKFFYDYDKFLVVTVTARGEKLFQNWLGKVEAKIRFLIMNLEKNPAVNIAHINPYPFEFPPLDADTANKNAGLTLPEYDSFEYDHTSALLLEKEHMARYCIGLTLDAQTGSTINLHEEIQSFVEYKLPNREKYEGINCTYKAGKRILEMVPDDKKPKIKDMLRERKEMLKQRRNIKKTKQTKSKNPPEQSEPPAKKPKN